jgi:quercetin dioxygenase-like cupin family protein
MARTPVKWLGLSSAEADRREGLFGGEGAVLVWDLLRGAGAEPFSAVLACELEPGGRVGRHVQQRDPEIVIGLEGEGTAEVDGLAIRNRSREAPLRYLIVKTRAGG